MIPKTQNKGIGVLPAVIDKMMVIKNPRNPYQKDWISWKLDQINLQKLLFIGFV